MFTFDEVLNKLLTIDSTIARYTEKQAEIDLAKSYLTSKVDYLNHPLLSQIHSKLARQYLDLILLIQTNDKEEAEGLLHSLSDGALKISNGEIVQIKESTVPPACLEDRDF